MAKQKKKTTTTKTARRMLSRREKATLAAGKLAELCRAEGVVPSIDCDRTLALAWAAAHAAEVLCSTVALPLPTTAQAAKLDGASVHALSKGEAMAVSPEGVEYRQHDGKAVLVTDLPDEVYHDLPRLRRTRRITDARKRVLASVGTMIRAAARIIKQEAKADQPAEQPAETPAE